MNQDGRYGSFFDLRAGEGPAHFRIERAERGSDILIFAPHGGGIEPGTSEVVKALAGDRFSYYCFEGVRVEGNERLHITSTRFDEPLGRKMAAAAGWVLAVHGCSDRREKVFVGGLHEVWIARFLESFWSAGFSAERGRGPISGRSPRNICNQGQQRQGVQIEISEALRRQMFRGLDRAGREHPTPAFTRFVAAGQLVLWG